VNISWRKYLMQPINTVRPGPDNFHNVLQQ